MSETGSIYEALLAVQAAAPKLEKTKTNPHFGKKYTPLDVIVDTIGPLLQEHGLVWMTRPGGTHEAPTLEYQLAHAKSKTAIAGEMPLMLDSPTAQKYGSALTYARRYAISAVLNLVSDDDDDGSEASAPRASARPYGGSQADPGDAPTAPQKTRITKTLKERGVTTVDEAAAIYQQILGRPLPEGKKFTEALTKREASTVIDRLNQGALPTGTSDVTTPEDGREFEHPKDDGSGTPLGDDEPTLPMVE